MTARQTMNTAVQQAQEALASGLPVCIGNPAMPSTWRQVDSLDRQMDALDALEARFQAEVLATKANTRAVALPTAAPTTTKLVDHMIGSGWVPQEEPPSTFDGDPVFEG